MNKKLLIRMIKSKACRRALSALVAVVLFFGTLPMLEISETIEELDFYSVRASGAEEFVDDDTDTQYQPSASGFVELTTDKIVAYSKRAHLYHKAHQNDRILIKRQAGSTSQDILIDSSFVPLGTEKYPFKGSITIAELSGIVLNLETPLFDYVFDSVKLTRQSTQSGIDAYPFEISRYYSANFSDTKKRTPLIANYVIHDSSSSTTNTTNTINTWNINVKKPKIEGQDNAKLQQFGGLVGTMCNNYTYTPESGESITYSGAAALKMVIKLNSENGDSSDVIIKGSGNTGFACGIMETNTELELDLTSDRKIAEVSTTGGNVGGFVGSMASGSSFTYTCTSTPFDASTVITTTNDNGYAGGVAGYCVGGTSTISANHTINQTITGKNGEGGLYGYFKPTADNTTIQTSNYKITDCVLDGSGESGGLIGVLDSKKNMTISVDGNISSVRNQNGTKVNTYGGLIGFYKVDSKSHSLTITGTSEKKVSANSFAKATTYGGGIGKIDNDVTSYVKFDGFTLDNAANANTLTFGGLVGNGNKAFIDAKDVKIKTSGTYKGGGLVGSLSYGVLRMDGTIDLTGAKSAEPVVDTSKSIDESLKVGVIVGYRDDALIYAKPGWSLKRNTGEAEVDDIGSWGQVIRFDGSSLNAENQLFTVDESAHTIQIKAPTTSYTTIGSVIDFAKTALCFQFDASKNAYVSFDSTDCTWEDDNNKISTQNITVKSDINLSGTGFAGLTRDNDIGGGSDSKHTFTGTLSKDQSAASRPTITLAIGEAYGNEISSHAKEGYGKQYRHVYNGLLGSVTDTTVSDIDFAGSIYVNAKRDTMFVGAAAAQASETFTATDINVTTSFRHKGASALSLGGILGEATNSIGNISIARVNVKADITGTASNGSNLFLGGVIGLINETSNAIDTWQFTNVTISGKIENTHGVKYNCLGGLVAYISHNTGTSKSNRSIELNTVKVEGLELSVSKTDGGDSPRTNGGLLGYGWNNVNVSFSNVVADEKVEGAVTTHNTIKITGADSNYGDIGGLVYCGTGYWTAASASQIQLKDLTVNSSAKKSIGLFVNKAWYASGTDRNGGTSSALYLELQNKDAYKITSAGVTGITGFSVFDEIAAYSAYYNDDANGNRTEYSGEAENLYVLQNGSAVISIKTDATHGLVMDNSSASKSYTAQTSEGNRANPYTRYYYNIDDIRTENSNQAKLMRWALNRYAHSSIKDYFNDTFGNNIPAPSSGIYDMQGYSWYPVDIDSSVTVNGTFKLYNKEFEGSEPSVPIGTEDQTFKRTSLNITDETPTTTQHYLLHNGLFRNVKSDTTLTVETVKLQGNVGKTSYGSGALICGKVQGTQNHKAYVNVTDTIILDRVYVHDISTTDYAPLAINKVGNYAQLKISAKHIREYNARTKVETSYRKMMDSLSSYPGLTHNTVGGVDCPQAGSSLIGNVDDESDSSKGASGVSIEFVNMVLDGRTKNLTVINPDDTYAYNSQLSIKYGTERSIFTQATFLNTFKYEPGSFGKYNFTWADDWDGFDPDSGTIAPHLVTYGKELGYTDSDTTTEYPGKERYYYGEPQEGETDKCFTSPVDLWDITGQYAAKFKNDFRPYVATAYNETNKTHQIMVNQSSAGFKGCGTYNDPYTLENGDNFEALSNTLQGNHSITDINVPLDSNGKPSISLKWHDATKGHANFMYLNSAPVQVSEGVTEDQGPGYYKDGVPAKHSSSSDLTKEFISKEKMEEYLAGAYYILSGDQDNIEITGTKFKGIGYNSNGTARAPFRGVIVGTGHTIVNKTAYPLIANANGCVLKDITLKVQSASNITVQGTNSAFGIADNSTTNAYGGLIGKVLGGDNIIENSLVDYSAFTKLISLTSTPQLAPVGGYIGVVVAGGVIFRKMDVAAADYSGASSTKKLTDAKITSSTVGSAGSPSVLDTNKAWLYVNPYVGRVINGYVVNESDAYRPFEDGTREYGDGTTLYWNSNGTVTTKTKAELNAMSTSEKTALKNAAVGVTLKNGTKHYSITDISTGENKLDVGNKSAIKVPNAQAWFVMSLIVNSGMGKKTQKTLGYNQDYQISRWAKYSNVATNPSLTTQPDDYTIAVNDSSSREGYLANAYTTNAAYAADIANYQESKKCIVTLSATSKTTYYLPDGYKGLGNVYQSDDKTRMKITTLDGGGNTISQNTLFYHYNSNSFDTGYKPNSASAAEYGIGMGLIPYQTVGATTKDLILAGNVKADMIDNKWTTVDSNVGYAHIAYSGNAYNNSYMFSVGSLFGCIKAAQELNSVGLQNVDVRGVKYVGGMIGTTSNLKTTITNPNKVASNKIKVHSGLIAGGVIGKMQENVIEFDFNNCSFSISEVVSECTATPDANYFNYGVGGIIGMCRSKISNGTGQNIIKNIIIGSEDDTECATVKCENANIYTGGLVGIFNRAYLDLSNCKIYNMNVEAQFAAGGLVGHWATAGGSSSTAEALQSKIANTVISGTISGKTPEIKSTGKSTAANAQKFCSAGGFLGSGKDDMNNVIIQNSSIDHYNITGIIYAGGAIGSWGDSSTSDTNGWKSAAAQFNNFMIYDCKIRATDSSSGAAGGLIGNLNDGDNKQGGKGSIRNDFKFQLYGYNVLSKDLTITGTNKGYICGRNGRTNTNDIKLVGYSRQGNNSTMISSLVGTALTDGSTSSTKPYGTNGYVIFADYNDYASMASTQYQWFSNLNDSKNVKTMRSATVDSSTGTTVYGDYDTNAAANTAAGHISGTKTTKNENYPFVTSSPMLKIFDSNILTGDGISRINLDDDYKYENSMFKKINDDINKTGADAVNKAYKTVTAISEADLTYIINHYSTSRNEFITSDITMPNFPLIVVEDSMEDNVNNLINNYLRTLTNTTYNFADTAANKKIYNLELRKMVYDGTKFTDQTGTAYEELANLRINAETKKFCMDSKYVDTGTTQQFTLVDVQFYDPSSVTETSGVVSGEIAYHLYVPVYTKKLLKFNFYASLASNTNYYKNAYTLDSNNFKANHLFENLGNLLTYAFEYQYTRTEQEWKDALNSGESVISDSNFRKTIIFDMMAGGENLWPSGTKMVLVDSTQEGKNYYLENISTTPSEETKFYLNLVDFKDRNNNSWKPAPFSELLNISVAEDNTNGTMLELTAASGGAAPAGATFYVKNSDGTKRYFRPINPEDGTVQHKYKIDSVTIAPERYYLTIITPDKTDKFYYNMIYSPSKFNRANDGSGNMAISLEDWRPNSIESNAYCFLLIGDIYEDNFATAVDNLSTIDKNESSLIVKTPRDNRLIADNNNTVTVTMTTTINLKDSPLRATIANAMSEQKDETQIYHAFLMMYGKKLTASGDELVGIVQNSQIVSSSFKVKAGAHNAADFAGAGDVVSYAIDKGSSSFIKLASDENLLDYLGDSTNGYAVSFQAEFTLAYYDEVSRSAQFPPNDSTTPDPEIGSKVIGYSNIASSSAGVAYSASSQKKIDSSRYYTANATAATLSYNMVENTTDTDEVKADGTYRSLGINAKTENEGYIMSSAEYDTHKLTTKGNYIEFTLTLSKKGSYITPIEGSPIPEGSTGLKISDYLSELKIQGADGTDIFDSSASFTPPEGVTVSTGGTSGNVYTIRAHKSKFKTRGTDDNIIYILPIQYKVKTGDGENKWNKTYSNYKVSLTAEMYNLAEGANAQRTYLKSSWVTDHLIYTNAKVEPNVI